ncbi:MAG: DUF2855 family protein [Actinomycetota bacterium]
MDLHVNRADLAEVALVKTPPAPLDDGQVRLRIDEFGLSANNITYAALGDAMRYWAAFPAPEGWGRVPVWGFAEVTESRHPAVAVGTRVFGFLPMSEQLVVTAGKASEHGFTDVAEHRRALAGAYNRYQVVTSAPDDAAGDGQRMLLFPLFMTSFLVDDFLADNHFFGADTLVISSASSKTALGVAWCAHRRAGIRVIGLTAPANLDFVTARGVYDDVLAYGAEAELPTGPTVYVDVSGSAAVRNAVHHRAGDALAHDMVLGATHLGDLGRADADLPGAKPAFFFAPSQIAKRTEEWGPGGLDGKIAEAWTAFSAWAGAAITLRRATGAAAVEAAYRELLENRSDPTVGHILSLQPTR